MKGEVFVMVKPPKELCFGERGHGIKGAMAIGHHHHPLHCIPLGGWKYGVLYFIFNRYSNSPWLWHVMILRCSHFGFKEIERARSLDHVFCSLLPPLGTWIPPISWGPHASSPSYEWYNLDHSVMLKVVQTSSCAHWYGTPRWEFK